jgi:hypothetical protein
MLVSNDGEFPPREQNRRSVETILDAADMNVRATVENTGSGALREPRHYLLDKETVTLHWESNFGDGLGARL